MYVNWETRSSTYHYPPPLLREPLRALRDGDQVLLQVDELLLLF